MLLEIALPVPVPRTFTYRADRDLLPGTRVRVRFAGRRLVGWVVGTSSGPPPARLAAVEAVLDEDPVVPAELLRVCRWVADYYIAPLGIVLRAALPAALSDARRGASPPVRTRRVVRLVGELPSLLERDRTFARAGRQRACYELLETLGGDADAAQLTGEHGFSSSVLRALVAKGLAELIEVAVERDPFGELPVPPAVRLAPTPAQRSAVLALTGSLEDEDRRPFLLRGVTGSGKTLVYIELLKEVMARGRGAIVLVPEIALTPQTVTRFRTHFGDSVAVLHSGLSDGERYDAWRAVRSGARRVVIGARSAVFAPVRDLGAIILDEEHEATYKQYDAEPRYHAREVAVVRAQAAGAVCLLGSATPSLESWHNAARGKFRLLELPERVEGRPLPPVAVVDLRAARAVAAEGGTRVPVLSPELVTAMQERLERREQSILLLNRRGYSTFVQCRECGAVRQCDRCNVSMTFHRMRRRVVCHYCFREEPPPVTCAECGSADLSFRGVGTEQVERAVGEAFPAARVARMDVDTTSGKWAHHRILSRVESGEIDILLGTQMIAKGLDFPRVTLVGVVNADVAMNLPDFRASERTFQLLTQVVGRAGRGPQGGLVIIQTALPNHYAIRSALGHDYVGFAERELRERHTPPYPPHRRLVNVLVTGLDADQVRAAIEEVAAWLTDAGAREGGGVQLIGPAPCPIDRVRERWRWHLLLRSAAAAPLGRLCTRLQAEGPLSRARAGLRLVIDRDPVSLL
jgi:primosomal protein N' (replication factor Y) (superfamily II helicase)